MTATREGRGNTLRHSQVIRVFGELVALADEGTPVRGRSVRIAMSQPNEWDVVDEASLESFSGERSARLGIESRQHGAC
jgi:hypothetical protein